MPKGFVNILMERCKGCGFCVEFCPTHVLALSSAFNSYYHETQVLGAETPETAKARLALVKAVEIVLENALDVLGIKVLEEM